MVWDDEIGEWVDDSSKANGYASKFGGLVAKRYPGTVVGVVAAGPNVEEAIMKCKSAIKASVAGGLAGVIWQQGHVEMDATMEMQHAYERDLYDKVWRFRGEMEIASWYTPFIAAPAPWLMFENFGNMHAMDRDMDPATATAGNDFKSSGTANGFGSAEEIAKKFYIAWAKVIRGLSC